MFRPALTVDSNMNFGASSKNRTFSYHAKEGTTIPPGAGREYVRAVFCVAAVTATRAALEPVLAGTSPLLIFVLPTVVLAMRSAAGPALCATVLSGVVAVQLFIRPADEFWWLRSAELVRLGLFLAVNLTIVVLGSKVGHTRATVRSWTTKPREQNPPRLPLTAVALVLAAIIVVATSVADISLIGGALSVLTSVEQNQTNQLMTVVLLIITAFVTDRRNSAQRTRHETTLQAERLRVVQVTMRTVQDIVNNALNQLQVLRLDAEGHVPEASLNLFDDTIRDTVMKVAELGNLKVFSEKRLPTGLGLDDATN